MEIDTARRAFNQGLSTTYLFETRRIEFLTSVLIDMANYSPSPELSSLSLLFLCEEKVDPKIWREMLAVIYPDKEPVQRLILSRQSCMPPGMSGFLHTAPDLVTREFTRRLGLISPVVPGDLWFHSSKDEFKFGYLTRAGEMLMHQIQPYLEDPSVEDGPATHAVAFYLPKDQTFHVSFFMNKQPAALNYAINYESMGFLVAVEGSNLKALHGSVGYDAHGKDIALEPIISIHKAVDYHLRKHLNDRSYRGGIVTREGLLSDVNQRIDAG